jgi:transposase-like protein
MHETSPAEPYIPRKSTRRDPWTEAEAHQALSAASRSGLSLSAFARHHGLSAPQLYWWHMRIRTHPSVDAGRLSLVQVALSPPGLAAEASGVEVVVGAAVVRVSRSFCEQTLARTVHVLRGLPC